MDLDAYNATDKLLELIDELVEKALGFGLFDYAASNDELWQKCAEVTNRDPNSGNRL